MTGTVIREPARKGRPLGQVYAEALREAWRSGVSGEEARTAAWAAVQGELKQAREEGR